MGFFRKLKDLFSRKKTKDVDVDDKTYEKGLSNSRQALSGKLKKIGRKSRKIDQEYFDELEETLIESDFGVDYTFDIIPRLTKRAKDARTKDAYEINDLLITMLYEDYAANLDERELVFAPSGPTVFLITGVNGVGKTTTIAKLAYLFKNRGLKVLLIGADTFRAGAASQLEIWAQRLEVASVEGKLGTDPSSIIYDGLTKAMNEKFDLVLIDVAGRLQTKTHLMDELKKIERVIKKRIPEAPHETFLVLDANTGQNGIIQAGVFKEVIPITGLILTKMDGTSKGGIALAVRRQLNLPIRYIGLGETPTDLNSFSIEAYLHYLFDEDLVNE